MTKKNKEALENKQREEDKSEKEGFSSNITELKNQVCPICHEKTLTLTESETEIPYFGLTYLFSMTCSNCKFHKADVESAEQKPPVRYSIDVSGEEDLKIRVVKSSSATLKIPRIVEITPGPASNGYVTNIEGVIKRVKHMFEAQKDVEEDNDKKKEYYKLIKKLNRVLWGSESIKIIIEDPTGNSAIISEKAKVEKLKISNKAQTE
ncbi:MAG: ZPR1 zinc finger domain-containing protein [Candidatus Woesearchaeota archaeon]